MGLSPVSRKGLLRDAAPPAAPARRARYFVLNGGGTVGELLDAAAAHGAVGRVVAHGTPRRDRRSCYGVAEVTPAPKRCAPRCRRFTSTPAAVICDDCGAPHPDVGPLVPLARGKAAP